MPLTKSVKSNVKELLADNRKSGKAKGANGKKRPIKQVYPHPLHYETKSY